MNHNPKDFESTGVVLSPIDNDEERFDCLLGRLCLWAAWQGGKPSNQVGKPVNVMVIAPDISKEMWYVSILLHFKRSNRNCSILLADNTVPAVLLSRVNAVWLWQSRAESSQDGRVVQL